MPYAPVHDVRLYYEEQGDGDSVVLLHAGLGAVGADMLSWAALLPAFTARYHVIQLDLRGHGRSDNPSGCLTWDQLAADVAAFVEQRKLAPTHVVGASLGGIAALRLGMTRPDLLRSLVSVGAFYTVDAAVRATIEGFDASGIERDDPAFAAALAAWHDPHHAPGYWRELVRQVRASVEEAPTYSDGDLQRITVPTLLVVGEADDFGILDHTLMMRRTIPHAEVLVLNRVPGENHLVHASRAEVVGPVIVDFLDRHYGPAVPAATG
jgi:pimeloyl-ACP methyl ester carboxylesterase